MKEKIKEFIIIFKKEHKYLYWTIILPFSVLSGKPS